MKIRNISKLAFLTLGYFLVISYDDGPANNNKDATNSPFDNATCSSTSCHGSNLSTGTLTVELRNSSNTPVTSYIPEEAYTIVTTIAGGTLTHYGFQLLVLNDVNNTSAVSIGTLSANSPNTVITDYNGKKYGEHSNQISSNVITLNWVAPAAGIGTAKVYAAAVNVNNNGAKTGDRPLDPITVSFTEDTGSGLQDYKLNSTLSIISNSDHQIDLLMNSKEKEGNFDFMILDMSGKIVDTKVLRVNQGENRFSFATENLAKGIYTIRVSDGVSFLSNKFSR